MIQTPSQPPHVADLALLAGFILLLIFEALFVPGGGRRTNILAGMPPPGASGASRPAEPPAPPQLPPQVP